MKRVFIDTGGFFAAVAPADSDHEHAKELFLRAEAERWALITTDVVVAETHALMLNRLRNGATLARSFLEGLGQSELHVEHAAVDDHRRAIALVLAHADKSYSLCDALSFVVMERLGVGEAIAFDRHFREYGKFTVL